MPRLYKAPVLLIIFNRSDTSLKVLYEIIKYAPPHLYIFCDGARNHIVGEKEQILRVRNVVLDNIPQQIPFTSLFYDVNKGPKVAVGEAITWFFQQVEEGIILEHDCLPHPDFFRFCNELLCHFRDNSRIWHIGGNNFQLGKKYGNSSYYFSLYNHIWGFATWRRAWKFYDNSLSDYPRFINENRIYSLFTNQREINFWLRHLKLVYEEKIKTWDAPWTLAMWMNQGLAVLPQVNLVSNIGFGEGAVNTVNTDNPMANITTQSLSEIVHNDEINVNKVADLYALKQVFYPSIMKIIYRKIKRALNLT